MDIIITAWFLFFIIYAASSNTFPAGPVIVRAIFMFTLYYSMRFSLPLQKNSGRIQTYLILAVCFVELLIGLYQLVGGYSRNDRCLVTGSFHNSGPYGTMMACGIILMFRLRQEYDLKYHAGRGQRGIDILLTVITCTMIFILFVTLSRAAIIALALSLSYMHRNFVRKHSIFFSSILILSMITLYFLKEHSANGRLVVWQVSIFSISRHIILGSGIGSFPNQYADSINSLSRIKPDGFFNETDVVHYAFNDFFQVGVEQGLVGIAFMVAMVISLIKQMRYSTCSVKYIIPVVLISSLFSYSLCLLPFQIMTIVACSSLTEEREKCYNIRVKPIFLVLVCLLIANLSAFPTVKRKVMAKTQYERLKGDYDKDRLYEYYRLLPDVSNSPEFIYDFAKTLSNAMRYNDSNAILRYGQLISADPAFYLLQGENFENMGFFDLAVESYEKAFYVMPNRISPLYKLMLIYEKLSQRSKAVSTAEKIISLPVKTKSQAVNYMREQAMKILRQNSISKIGR